VTPSAAGSSEPEKAGATKPDPLNPLVPQPREDAAASKPSQFAKSPSDTKQNGGTKKGEEDPKGKDAKKNGEEDDSKKRLGFLRELPALIILAFILALLIKTFLVQAFFIPSASMEATLLPGDRVLVNKIDYLFHDPRRGDVIVFENPHPVPEPHRNPIAGAVHWLSQGLGFSQSPDEDFIKRVIGLPGDTVKVAADGTYVNGIKLVEPYVFGDGPGPLGTWHVPADSVFVMGDNRSNSNDSRVSLGPIPMDKIVGKAFVKIWPPSRIGGL
jgi:signal peptidase I